MKVISIVSLVLAALLVIGNRAAHYWLGYSEIPAAFALSDRFFGVMAEFALFMLLIIPALWTEFAKKGRLWSYVGLLGFWPVVIVTFLLIRVATPSGGELTMRGLRDRIMHDYTLDDLRRFAREVDEAGLLKDEDLVNQADTSGFTPQLRYALTQLAEKYSFMRWLEDDEQWFGPSLLNHAQDGVVDFEWGGGNRGHWGCSISINGSKNEPVSGPPAKILRVSDDIYFFFRA